MSFNDTFKALSDPTRRTILDMLKERDMTAGEIADHFEMTKPAISHHLNLLKQAELVVNEKKGQHIHYSINLTMFEELMTWMLKFNSNEGA
ncbi:autorepressor SdpR family transcription factor [Saccharibacillus qingshengii]|uniref:autorepressor SdpR family transcription factor n=1 Tax=Saccharibacillus qingshengii TaxID=1763540 RepID=UPI001552236C|nr:autorepressor SdpR family transcription factor [Saccharibacillus qingshengii]